MRILLVNSHGTDPTYGGAERRTRYLAEGMTERGHQVEILSAFPQAATPSINTQVLHTSDWRTNRVRRVRNHIGDLLSPASPAVADVIDTAAPEIVHTHNLPGIGTGIWEVARRRSVPVVHSILDYYLLCPRTSLLQPDGSPCSPHPLLCGTRTRRLMRWHRGVSRVLGTSQFTLNLHEGLFPEAETETMPPPMMPLRGSSGRTVACPPQTIGFIGSLSPEKGVRLLLEAAPRLSRLGLRLRIAGSGPLRREVESCADLDYVGRLRGPALAEFVDSCDIGIVPSLWDEPGGPPWVVGEWLGSGRPVLATRRGGLAEAEPLAGVRCFSETNEDLAALVEEIRRPDVWSEMVAGIEPIDGEATLAAWLDRHERIYMSVAGRAQESRS